jgi:hypothetical protein
MANYTAIETQLLSNQAVNHDSRATSAIINSLAVQVARSLAFAKHQAESRPEVDE